MEDEESPRRRRKRSGPPMGGGELEDEVELPPAPEGYEDYDYYEAGSDALQTGDGGGFDAAPLDIDIEANTDNAIRSIGAFRFVNVVIPQGATIDSAVLTLETSAGGDLDPALDIHGDDADDSASFVATPSIVSRTFTTASVAVTDPISAGQWTSPDISDVLQEIVDRAGWASGNAMTIILNGYSELGPDGVNFKSLAAGGVPSLTIFFSGG